MPFATPWPDLILYRERQTSGPNVDDAQTAWRLCKTTVFPGKLDMEPASQRLTPIHASSLMPEPRPHNDKNPTTTPHGTALSRPQFLARYPILML
jgi:hypothetical protein